MLVDANTEIFIIILLFVTSVFYTYTEPYESRGGMPQADLPGRHAIPVHATPTFTLYTVHTTSLVSQPLAQLTGLACETRNPYLHATAMISRLT